jgi:hypothetical protein
VNALRIAVAAAALGVLGGCAMYGAPLEENSPGVEHANVLTPAQAQARVNPGTSTKADVAAALGPANVVAFDSGWEVWVYRWLGTDHSARAATEVVVLFDPSGTARKVRMRPGYAS